ncbi:MAG: hypothetical protein H6822_13975 [Planctomycetaceae bacterium]|nr:hypothetical protein [Planctomycetales bacterium]MCB9923286.1 hypothetical protein [Planctomycetaceae bacterium]
MRRWIAILSSCVLLTITSFTSAESPPDLSLLARSRWAQFQIVFGRIEVANIHSSQNRTATSGGESSLLERLTISGDTDIPSVRYERILPDETVAINVINGFRVEIDRQCNASQEAAPVSFRQTSGAHVVLRIGADKNLQSYRAPSLWHLILAEPEACETHLLPLLNLMQPSWQFDRLVANATDELIREAASSDFELRHTTRKLITRLKSSDFTARQQAEVELCSLGVGILPHLDRLSETELTREQQRRIETVRHRLRGREADSPERLALWLVEDEHVWLSMLGHEELAVRRFAATHLTKRYTKSLDFDPHGTPSERQQQVARIRADVLLR